MSSNPIPVRVPERQEVISNPPAPKNAGTQKPSKFIIKILGQIPG